MRSRRALRAHQRVALVALTFIAGGCAVLALTSAQGTSVRAKMTTIQQQLLPQQQRLADVAANLATARAALGDATRAPDVTTRTSELQRALDASNAAVHDWAAFEHHAPGQPGERRLEVQFDAASASAQNVGRAAGLAILDAPEGDTVPPSPPVTSALAATDTELARANTIDRDIYRPAITNELSRAHRQLAAAQTRGLIAFVVALVVGIFVTLISARAARRQERELEEQERDRARVARRNDFDTRLGRALEMAGTEEQVYDVVDRGLLEALGAASGELLIADSSRAHYRQVLHTGPSPGGECGVASPGDCPAARRGQALVFESTARLDACPLLRASPAAPCSAVCVPVAVGGRSVGVVHTDGPVERAPDAETVTDLELIARKAGERVGMLRAFADTEAQAQTDPLTGLWNRRSVENRVRDLVAAGHQYVVAYGDLDRFKDLNDTHGHDTGDRALRVFARVLRDSVRPGDIPGRYGGEEFLVVLPDCAVPDAVSVMERLRESLALALTSGAAPSFTVSFGVAPSDPTATFDEVVALADAALLAAKRSGRNRVVASVEGATATPSGGERIDGSGSHPAGAPVA